jgi:hypothetical protein
MAKAKDAARAEPVAKPAVDPSKHYRVKLARAVEIAPGIWARPSDDVTMDGDQIAGHGDAIASYEEV